jgi:hypothetical protein
MWLIIPVVLYHAFEHPAIEVGRKIAEKLSLPRQAILAPEQQEATALKSA